MCECATIYIYIRLFESIVKIYFFDRKVREPRWRSGLDSKSKP